jgi:hypothetical protein
MYRRIAEIEYVKHANNEYARLFSQVQARILNEKIEAFLSFEEVIKQYRVEKQKRLSNLEAKLGCKIFSNRINEDIGQT